MFEKELEQLINRYSKENESNTPDWILCQFIVGSLAAFNEAVQKRETFYGRDARPSGGQLQYPITPQRMD